MQRLSTGINISIRDPRGDEALEWETFVIQQQAVTYTTIPADFAERSMARFSENAELRHRSFAEPGTAVRKMAFANERLIGVAEVKDGGSDWEQSLGIESIGVKRVLSRLYLSQDARGTGLAATLLNEVAGNDALYLWLIDENVRAHRFYLKHGFVDVDESVETGETWGQIPMHRMIRPAGIG